MAWCSVPGPYTLRMSQSRCLIPYRIDNALRVCHLVRVVCQCRGIAGTVRFVYLCRCSECSESASGACCGRDGSYCDMTS